MIKVATILACHNRRELTVRAIEALVRQKGEIEHSILLVDDGSSDGTAAAVRSRWPDVRILQGDGHLYWARSMAWAEREALALEPDYLLWLNDDVQLAGDALETLLAVAVHEGQDAIAVGAVTDPTTQEIEYSGISVAGFHPLRVERVVPTGRSIRADTFNGNVVLVPISVAKRLGGIDGKFGHALADFDYGLRARRIGVSVIVSPRSVGTCRRIRPTMAWRDRSTPIVTRWRAIASPKGVPPAPYARYLRRHGGFLWPAFWAVPYVRLFAASLVDLARGAHWSDHPARVASGDDAGRNLGDDDTAGADD